MTSTASDTISAFINYFVGELRHSAQTGLSYAGALQRWERWLVQRDRSLATTLPGDAREYASELARSNRGLSSIRLALAALRAFYAWAEQEKGWDAILVPPVRQGNCPKRLRKRLSDGELCVLLAAVAPKKKKEGFRDIRDRALLFFLYTTALRREELHRLSLDDVDVATRRCHVSGKGNKDRIVFFTESAAAALQQWLEVRPTGSGNALFVTSRGRRISYRHIANIVKAIGKRANITNNVSPHSLRHTLASRLVEENVDLGSVRQLLGHESLATTGLYLQVNERHARAMYDRANLMGDRDSHD